MFRRPLPVRLPATRAPASATPSSLGTAAAIAPPSSAQLPCGLREQQLLGKVHPSPAGQQGLQL
eukprot:6602135-Pyramimonas_sp.AAC.1